jgi:hypothetical protein
MGKSSDMRGPLLQSGNVILFMISPYYNIGLRLSIEIVLWLGSIAYPRLYSLPLR